MYASRLRAGVILVGVALAAGAGCRTEAPRTGPGALPLGPQADVSPRLHASTYFAHAHLLERQGNLEGAVGQYRQALQLAPNFVSARNRLGITLNKLGRHAEASAEFARAVELSPSAAYLRNNLGFSQYLEGRYEASAATLQRVLELQPNFARARMNRGLALARLGRYADALQEFRLATDEADAYYNVAVLQAEACLFLDAAHSLENALRLNPDFEAAREQLRAAVRLAAEAELARRRALPPSVNLVELTAALSDLDAPETPSGEPVGPPPHDPASGPSGNLDPPR